MLIAKLSWKCRAKINAFYHLINARAAFPGQDNFLFDDESVVKSELLLRKRLFGKLFQIRPWFVLNHWVDQRKTLMVDAELTVLYVYKLFDFYLLPM